MLCDTEVQRTVCYVPGYAIICPVISQEVGNSNERHTSENLTKNHNQYSRTKHSGTESTRRWKCPTCKYNDNAHYSDYEERPAGLSTADQRQELGFSNQSYQQKPTSSNTSGRAQGQNSYHSGRFKAGDKNYDYKKYGKENSTGYNPYNCSSSCNENEKNDFWQKVGNSKESPYIVRIYVGPPTPMPKKINSVQNRQKNKHSEKKKVKASHSSRTKFKEKEKNVCYSVYINYAVDPCTKYDTNWDSKHDYCDCERTENPSQCCPFNQEQANIIPAIVGFISGWQMPVVLVEESDKKAEE